MLFVFFISILVLVKINDMKRFPMFMMDYETLATQPDAVVMEISIVPFNIFTGMIGDAFQSNISVKSCLDSGLVIDEETKRFWEKQPQNIKDHVFKEDAPDWQTVISKAHSFIIENRENEDCIMMSRGTDFDISIFNYQLRRLNIKAPFKHYRVRDARTFCSLKPELASEIDESYNMPMKHTASYDCHKQIHHCMRVCQFLPSELVSNIFS